MGNQIGSGEFQRKILLLLLGGLTLGLSGSPRRYFRIVRMIGKEWNSIEREALRRSIRSLYQSRLISSKTDSEGMITLILTAEGKERALKYNLDTMSIPNPKSWDGKWRVVLFDIPEKRKRVRDILRNRLRQLGMIELQKSVFVHPHPCKDEVDFLTEFYRIRPHVRTILADDIDNKLHLKLKFRIS